jgi:hypothetical protein
MARNRLLPLLTLTLGCGSLLASCTGPDPKALKTLACEQVASSVDLQSVGQLDALRKALGVAPDVDPLQTCRSLGVTMEGGGDGGRQDAPAEPER